MKLSHLLFIVLTVVYQFSFGSNSCKNFFIDEQAQQAKIQNSYSLLDLTYLKNLIDQADPNSFKPDSQQSKVLSQLKNGDVFNEFTVLLNNIINLSTYKVPFRDGSQEGHVHWYEENYGGENRIAFSISHSDKLKAVFSKESGNKTSKDPSPIVDFDDLSSDILSRGDFLFVEGLIYKAKSYPDFGQEPIPVKGVIKFNRSSNNMLIKFDFPHAFDLLTTNGNVIEFNTNFYSFYSQNEKGDFVSTLKESYLSENAKRVMKRYFTLVEAVKDAKDLNLELDKEIKNSILNKIIQFKMEIDSLQQQSNPSPPKGFSLKGIVNFFGRNLPK